MITVSKNAWLTMGQVILLMLLAFAFRPAWLEIDRVHSVSEERAMELAPALTESQMRGALESTKWILDRYPLDENRMVPRADDYFTTLLTVRRTEAALKRFVHDHPDEAARLTDVRPLGDEFSMQVSEMQVRYEQMLGHGAMTAAVDRNQSAIQEIDALSGISSAHIDSRFGELFIGGYGLSIVIMFLFFGTRLERQDKMKVVEAPRWIALSLVWFATMWFYPTRINPVLQTKQALRFAAYLLAAVLSGAPAAFAKANGERNPGSDDSGANANTLVVGDDWLPKMMVTVGAASMKLGANDLLLHDGPIITWDVNAKFGNGLTLDHAGTRASSGSNGSDEDDWGVSFNRSIGAGTSLTAGVAIYDIRPLASTKGGDFIAPTLEVDHDVAGTTLYGFGEFDALTARSKNDAYTIRIGERRSWDIGHGLSVGENMSFVQGDGPFGHTKVDAFRYDGSLSAKVNDRLSVFGWLKGFVPLSSGKDHPRNVAVGGGLSFAVN